MGLASGRRRYLVKEKRKRSKTVNDGNETDKDGVCFTHPSVSSSIMFLISVNLSLF
jgi:hypothetical protein